MNPFDQYRGIFINGEFYDKEHLHHRPAENNNAALALGFAGELFSERDGISVQTSGSTGNPKNIIFSKEAFIISAQATNNFFGLDRKSNTVLPLPMQYIAGKMMVARAIVGGYNLIVLQETAHIDMSGLHADFMPVTPLQMINLIDNKPATITQIGTYLIGGGAASEALISKINNAGIKAYASFGMTETLSHFALADLTDSSEHPIYKPVEGVSLRISDEAKLEVNWPGITEGWLNTNDLVDPEPDGFKWLGRADNLINSGGIKIIPERVEQILDKYIPTPFFVAAISHQSLGEELVLITEEETDVDLNGIEWDFKHQKPKRIIVINPFSRTVSGKVRRSATIKQWREN